MAKRRRLIPNPQFAPVGLEDDTGIDVMPRPVLSGGLAASPPIARVAGDAAAQAALDELAGVLSQARAEGRMVLRLPLAQIDLTHLVRDRIALDEEELDNLIGSIRLHGQRMPIEVCDLGDGRYGLISGWRRMQALLRLSGEDARFATVQALLRQPADAADAYIAMVEENEVRQGLSYYERARIAARAVDLGVFASEKQALQGLFAAASRARRSKIGSFLGIYRALDPLLSFPTAIAERLGLALAKTLEEDPAARADLVAQLQSDQPATAEAELALLTAFLSRLPATEQPVAKPAPEQVAKPPLEEMRAGVFLEVGGGFTKPILTISGPGVDPVFRERLEHWLRYGS